MKTLSKNTQQRILIMQAIVEMTAVFVLLYVGFQLVLEWRMWRAERKLFERMQQKEFF